MSRLIYGLDDRQEVYEVSANDPLVGIARVSVLAVGRAEEIAPSGKNAAGEEAVRVTSPSAGARLGLCPGERFGEQPAFALCSGFAVAPHLMLTAAHCLTVVPTASLAVVSGFFETDVDAVAPITGAQVHAVSRVVAEDRTRDYALVEVDGAPLVPVGLAVDMPSPGQAVSSANHGMGVPAKLAAGAQVFSVGQGAFVTNLDSFGGASGAPVVDEAGLVLGMLTSGASDYDVSETGCLTARHASDGSVAANELVEHAKSALDDLCSAGVGSAPCADAPSRGGCSISRGSDRDQRAIDFVMVGVLTATVSSRRRRRGNPASAGHRVRPGCRGAETDDSNCGFQRFEADGL